MPHKMKSFSQILHEVTGGTDPMCTISEIAGTDAHRAYNNGDARSFDMAVDRMRADIKDLQAEGGQL